ncbi:unnamed protein product [Acanthosepion pharaonis]|uniref:Uncharacterized protein n=1 Tax=Acanthosepion pharaonis TaxID=158019 RepID=A0A812DQ75_ACAPH|nr:unnamed protein product [Sepia pharaonis]
MLSAFLKYFIDIFCSFFFPCTGVDRLHLCQCPFSTVTFICTRLHHNHIRSLKPDYLCKSFLYYRPIITPSLFILSFFFFLFFLLSFVCLSNILSVFLFLLTTLVFFLPFFYLPLKCLFPYLRLVSLFSPLFSSFFLPIYFYYLKKNLSSFPVGITTLPFYPSFLPRTYHLLTQTIPEIFFSHSFFTSSQTLIYPQCF